MRSEAAVTSSRKNVAESFANRFADYNELRKNLLLEEHRVKLECLREEQQFRREEHALKLTEHQYRMAQINPYGSLNVNPTVNDVSESLYDMNE